MELDEERRFSPAAERLPGLRCLVALVVIRGAAEIDRARPGGEDPLETQAVPCRGGEDTSDVVEENVLGVTARVADGRLVACGEESARRSEHTERVFDLVQPLALPPLGLERKPLDRPCLDGTVIGTD